jgi:hypothetical protein
MQHRTIGRGTIAYLDCFECICASWRGTQSACWDLYDVGAAVVVARDVG